MLFVSKRQDLTPATPDLTPATPAGLEWLYRFASEPRRLGRRYLVTNTVFIVAAARQLLGR